MLQRIPVGLGPSRAVTRRLRRGHFRVYHYDFGSALLGFEVEFKSRIWVLAREFGCSPFLDDLLAWLKLNSPAGYVAVPSGKFCTYPTFTRGL